MGPYLRKGGTFLLGIVSSLVGLGVGWRWGALTVGQSFVLVRGLVSTITHEQPGHREGHGEGESHATVVQVRDPRAVHGQENGRGGAEGTNQPLRDEVDRFIKLVREIYRVANAKDAPAFETIADRLRAQTEGVIDAAKTDLS